MSIDWEWGVCVLYKEWLSLGVDVQGGGVSW
jgi:hypothetical protein